MFDFQPHEAHSMLAFMLDPEYNGLTLVIDYVGREWAFQIAKNMTNKYFSCS